MGACWCDSRPLGSDPPPPRDWPRRRRLRVVARGGRACRACREAVGLEAARAEEGLAPHASRGQPAPAARPSLRVRHARPPRACAGEPRRATAGPGRSALPRCDRRGGAQHGSARGRATKPRSPTGTCRGGASTSSGASAGRGRVVVVAGRSAWWRSWCGDALCQPLTGCSQGARCRASRARSAATRAARTRALASAACRVGASMVSPGASGTIPIHHPLSSSSSASTITFTSRAVSAGLRSPGTRRSSWSRWTR